MFLRNKILISIIFFAITPSCLFSMEERENGEKNAVLEENNSSAQSTSPQKKIKLQIGEKVFEIESTILESIKVLKNMFDALETDDQQPTPIDYLFPNPDDVQENQKNFEAIIDILRSSTSLEGLLDVDDMLLPYQIQEFISLLICADKLNVDNLTDACIYMCARYIKKNLLTIKELSEILESFQEKKSELFYEVCSKILPNRFMPLQSFSIDLDSNAKVKNIFFNRERTNIIVEQDDGRALIIPRPTTNNITSPVDVDLQAHMKESETGIYKIDSDIYCINPNKMLPPFNEESDEESITYNIIQCKYPLESLTNTLKALRCNKITTQNFENIAFSHDGKFVAMRSSDSFLIWDLSQKDDNGFIWPIIIIDNDTHTLETTQLYFDDKQPLLYILEKVSELARPQDLKEQVIYTVDLSDKALQSEKRKNSLNAAPHKTPIHDGLYVCKNYCALWGDCQNSYLKKSVLRLPNNRNSKLICHHNPNVLYAFANAKWLGVYTYQGVPKIFSLMRDFSIGEEESQKKQEQAILSNHIFTLSGRLLATYTNNHIQLWHLGLNPELLNDRPTLLDFITIQLTKYRETKKDMIIKKNAAQPTQSNNSIFAKLWNYCRPSTIKQKITQHPWLTAGIATATAVTGYAAYKKWTRKPLLPFSWSTSKNNALSRIYERYRGMIS